MTRVPPPMTDTDPGRTEHAETRATWVRRLCQPAPGTTPDIEKLQQCARIAGRCVTDTLPYTEFDAQRRYCNITQPQKVQECLAQQLARLTPQVSQCIIEHTPKPRDPDAAPARTERQRPEYFFANPRTDEPHETKLRRLGVIQWAVRFYSEFHPYVLAFRNPDAARGGMLAEHPQAAKTDRRVLGDITRIFAGLTRSYLESYGHFEDKDLADASSEQAVAFAARAALESARPGGSLYRLLRDAWDPLYLPDILLRIEDCRILRVAIRDLQLLRAGTTTLTLQVQIEQDIAERQAQLIALGDLAPSYQEFFAERVAAMTQRLQSAIESTHWNIPEE